MLLSISLLFLISCATEIPDFRIDLTLPGSEDCYGKYVVSQKSERIPKDNPICKERKRKALSIAPDQYSILKKGTYKNCIYSKCKQAVEVIDELVLTIDKAVESVYGGSVK